MMCRTHLYHLIHTIISDHSPYQCLTIRHYHKCHASPSPVSPLPTHVIMSHVNIAVTLPHPQRTCPCNAAFSPASREPHILPQADHHHLTRSHIITFTTTPVAKSPSRAHLFSHGQCLLVSLTGQVTIPRASHQHI